MISAAVGRGGETMISAQTTEAFWNAVKHVKPLSVGLNCSLGPDLMYPFLERAFGEGGRGDLVLSECGAAESAVGDGLRPGTAGHGAVPGEFAQGGLINIAGGCCGNTPEHIAAIAKALEGQAPRNWGEVAA
jgi:5-methyltetrahydrofolate--homocysteine methyltransferase